jgi:hypothetical protein
MQAAARAGLWSMVRCRLSTTGPVTGAERAELAGRTQVCLPNLGPQSVASRGLRADVGGTQTMSEAEDR